MSNTKKEPLLSQNQITQDENLNTSRMTTSSCGYEMPNIYDEGYEMLLCAIMIYGAVDLRTLARRGLLDGDSPRKNKNPDIANRLLQLPVSASEIVELVAQNKSTIQKEIGEESTTLYIDAFDSIEGQNDDDGLEMMFNEQTGGASFVSFDVCVVDDANSNKELVYGICVHRARKRITVIFRGCTTTKDWAISADPFLTEQINPVVASIYGGDENASSSRRPNKVALHHGFYHYLLSSKSSSNKFEQIVDNVNKLLEKYPDYNVYVTGHSLGGALATVFAYEAAAFQKFGPNRPITCISIASPMVGNLSFERAFKELEREGHIRCLRITNHYDIFTQLPDRSLSLYAVVCCFGLHILPYVGSSCLFYMCFQNNVYRHVGMDLHLYEYGRYKLKHTRGSADNYFWRVAQDWKKHMKQTAQRLMTIPFACFCDACFCREDFDRNHSVKEHMVRLKAISTKLSGVFLDDLYKERRFNLQ